MSLELSPKDEFPSDVHVSDVRLICIEPSDVECRSFQKLTWCFVLSLRSSTHCWAKLIFNTFPNRMGKVHWERIHIWGTIPNHQSTNHSSLAFCNFVAISGGLLRYSTLLKYSSLSNQGKIHIHQLTTDYCFFVTNWLIMLIHQELNWK